MKQKLIVILGPTASGKTALSLRLAKKFKGYVISADSRQIYQELNIGTDKIKGKKCKVAKQPCVKVEAIEHFMIDVVKPSVEYSVARYQKDVFKIITNFSRINRELPRELYANSFVQGVPFLVGGTGLYINSIVDNWQFPGAAPDKKLRAKLKKMTREALLKKLKKLDPEKAKSIDKSKRRMIRAIEASLKGHTRLRPPRADYGGRGRFDVLMIGIKVPREKLYKKINLRVDQMLKKGLVKEAIRLGKKYGWAKLAMSGIGYKQIGEWAKRVSLGFKTQASPKKIPPEVIERIKSATRQYARRQMVWFKRDKRIKWVTNQTQAERLVKKFLN